MSRREQRKDHRRSHICTTSKRAQASHNFKKILKTTDRAAKQARHQARQLSKVKGKGKHGGKNW